jgi:hypothetical protein
MEIKSQCLGNQPHTAASSNLNLLVLWADMPSKKQPNASLHQLRWIQAWSPDAKYSIHDGRTSKRHRNRLMDYIAGSAHQRIASFSCLKNGLVSMNFGEYILAAQPIPVRSTLNLYLSWAVPKCYFTCSSLILLEKSIQRLTKLVELVWGTQGKLSGTD